MSTINANFPLSKMAENLIGSEIIKLAGEINQKIKQGEKIFNLTIGDFDPKIFPIPISLRNQIIETYKGDFTNYPPADGMLELRTEVSNFLNEFQQLNYAADEILIAGGARPLIYAIYQTIIDKDDTILFPVPSWNNNHYTHLSHGKQIFVETKPENKFMPTAADLAPYIQQAHLLALCSPLNPTGTTFTENDLRDICKLVVDENIRRGSLAKPLYIMYDQIYWVLTYDGIKHVDPVSLFPELKNYTIYVDGISKSLAATGVRVGWSFGPKFIIDKMKSILGHVGAWAPKVEQIAVANYLKAGEIQDFLTPFKISIYNRLNDLYNGLLELKNMGLPVDVIKPEAAIYLTIQFNFIGYTTPKGKLIEKTSDITSYVLEKAKVAIVPFSAFGASNTSTWYRASVGTIKQEDTTSIIKQLKDAFTELKKV